jgi:hypothetical protein
MSKFLHGPPKFSSGPLVVRGPPVGDRCSRLHKFIRKKKEDLVLHTMFHGDYRTRENINKPISRCP